MKNVYRNVYFICLEKQQFVTTFLKEIYFFGHTSLIFN